MFLRHPEDTEAKNSSNVEFSIKTFGIIIKMHQWYFQEKPISSEEANYRGSTTDTLTITKCSPEHTGVYKCVVNEESGKTFTSESAILTVGKLMLVLLYTYNTVYQVCMYYCYTYY